MPAFSEPIKGANVRGSGMDRMLDLVEWRALGEPHVSMAGDPDALYATHEGVLDFGPFQLRCYSLNDGQRVFDADDVAAVFSKPEAGTAEGSNPRENPADV